MRYRFLALALALALSGCVVQRQKPQPSDVFGPSTVTGTISATGASLYRRGTHVLLVSGRPRLFLESRSVDLNQYRDARAVVRGGLSPNTHEKFLPVLTVESVHLIGEPVPPPLQRYSVEALNLSLEAPRSWLQEIAGGSLTFRLPSETAPFIRIAATDVSSPPEGLRVRIDGRNGVRAVDEGGMHNVFVEHLLFTFAPKGEESALLRDAFYTMIRSVRFDPTSPAFPLRSASRSFEGRAGELRGAGDSEEKIKGSGQPCGGPAAVICPEGEYCEVKELDTGIGRCRKL